MILVALGSVRSVWNGQSNILLISMIVLAAVMIIERRWWLASGLLAATAIIKVWPLALCGLLFVHFPRQLFVPMATCLFGLLAIPILTTSPSVALDQYVFWWQSMVNNSSGRWPGFRDAWTIWEALGGEVNLAYYQIVQAVSGLAALALTFRLRNLEDRQKVFLILCLWICWQLIFGPGTERATYSVFAPIFALAALLDNRRYAWLIYPSGALFILFTHGSMERTFEQWVPVADTFITLSVVVFLLWTLLQIFGYKDGHAGRQDSARS